MKIAPGSGSLAIAYLGVEAVYVGIGFLIYVVVLFAFNCIFIIGARTPKGK